MDVDAILRQADFFPGISDAGRRAVAEICLTRDLQKKEILFLEGDEGYAFFYCVRGSIQLHKSLPDGKEIVIKIIKPGELFGEVILFEQNHYPVSALALQPSRVLILPKIQFHCLLEREEFRNDFILMLMKKQRYLANRIKYLSGQDVEDRLINFLRDHFGERENIRIGMSKKDVAAAIGATPETLSRLLLKLKQERRLVWEGKTIRVNPSIWKSASG